MLLNTIKSGGKVNKKHLSKVLPLSTWLWRDRSKVATQDTQEFCHRVDVAVHPWIPGKVDHHTCCCQRWSFPCWNDGNIAWDFSWCSPRRRSSLFCPSPHTESLPPTLSGHFTHVTSATKGQMCIFFAQHRSSLEQRSPTFLAPRTALMTCNIFTDRSAD